ncbi:MAG: alpha/beta hydrolase [Firmicutes bacterium]|nr:alpha/beta hydrolase [Bacillota bacterium]
MFISSNNHKTQYALSGEMDAPTVIFLHGWGGSLDSFSYFADKLALTGYRTLNIAFAGHGESDPPTDVWGIADYCKPLLELIKSLDIQKATLVGHSFGGRAAIWIAANHPELVSNVVLVDSAGLKPKRGLRYKYKVWKYKRAKATGKDTSKYGSADYQNLPENIRASFVKIVNEDLTDLLPLITAPTLIVWGTADKDTPMYMAKKLVKDIKDSGLVKIEGGGHWAYAEQAGLFLSILKKFLNNA